MYAAAGTENWLALSVSDDTHWQALRTHEGRWAQHDVLDAELGAWAVERLVDETVAPLVQAGAPAARLVDPRFVREHPQISARGVYERVDHPVAGVVAVPVLPLLLDVLDRWARAPAPLVGERNADLPGCELSMKKEELAALAERGVIGDRPAGV
ncbi:CoA transferase [Streptomyces sp. NPDC055681]